MFQNIKNKRWLQVVISVVSLFLAFCCFSSDSMVVGLAFCILSAWLFFFPKLQASEGMNTREFFAVCLMIVPCVLSCFKIHVKVGQAGMLLWKKEVAEYFYIRPNFLSLVLGIALYASLFAKHFISLPKRLYDYLILVCDILFLSSFLNVFLSDNEVKIFRIIITEQTLAIFAIIMSYIGIKAVAGFAWIALLIWGLSHAAKINEALGVAAIPYILCAFVSILLQVQDEVKLRKMLNDGFALAKQGMKQVGGDVAASGKVVQETARTIASVTGSAVGAIAAAKQDKSAKSAAEKHEDYIDRIVPAETGLPTDTLQP